MTTQNYSSHQNLLFFPHSARQCSKLRIHITKVVSNSSLISGVYINYVPAGFANHANRFTPTSSLS